MSNSWGGNEYSGQTTDDSHFNHPGVAITVSSGDSGNGAEYPATSRYVTAVGGTSLRTASNSRGWTETAWSGAGSGCSSFDAKPTWQTVTTNCTRRAEADVSAVADPNTGVAVYQTYGASGWSVYGGTSAASPIIASVYALAGTPGASDYPASYPYAHPGNLFDVTSGSNGSCGSPQCTAGTGWDGPTGLGTPNGTAAFTAGTGGTGVTVNNPGNQTSTVGTPVSLTVTASGGSGSFSWSASGLPAGLSINASTGVISGTPTTAGTSTVTVTATSGTQSGSATFTWTVNSTSPSTVISLRAHANTRYVCADNAGASPLIANRTAIGAWETFDVLNAGNGNIALRSHANNMIVTAENAGASALIANRTAIGSWETFQLIHNADGSVSLRALINNKYVTAENAGASALIANRTAIGAWEEFDLIND